MPQPKRPRHERIVGGYNLINTTATWSGWYDRLEDAITAGYSQVLLGNTTMMVVVDMQGHTLVCYMRLDTGPHSARANYIETVGQRAEGILNRLMDRQPGGGA